MSTPLDETRKHQGNTVPMGDNGRDDWNFGVPSGETYSFAQLEVVGNRRGGARIHAQPQGGVTGSQRVTVSWWFDGTANPTGGKGFVEYRIRAHCGAGGGAQLLKDDTQTNRAAVFVEGRSGNYTVRFDIPSGRSYGWSQLDILGQRRGGARISEQPAAGATGRKSVVVNWWYDGGPLPSSGRGFITFRIRVFVV